MFEDENTQKALSIEIHESINKKLAGAYSPNSEKSETCSQKSASSLPISAVILLIVEFFTRLTFYGPSKCFFLYMTDMLGWNTSTANAAFNGFIFWSFFSTFIGAYIADAHLGRYKTILYFGYAYFVGLALLTLGATRLGFSDFSNPPKNKTGFATYSFIVALFLLGLGTGGIKNISPMVADQLQNISAADVEKIFKLLYWAINAGSFVGGLVCPNLHHFGPKFQGPGMDGPKGTSYWIAYLFPTVAFMIGFCIYIVGKRYYSFVRPAGSLISRMIGLTWHAAKEQKNQKRAAAAQPNQRDAEGDYENVQGFLDYAFPTYTKQEIADLRQTLHACRALSVFPIFWPLNNQMSTNFIEQGTMMKGPSWLTADQLTLVNSLVIIVFIPFCQYWFYPWIRSFGFQLGCISRISIGFAITAASFVYAGVLQVFINQSAANSVSIWLQIPAYAHIGMGEIFSATTGLEYVYAVGPGNMKSLCMSLFMLTIAIASLIGLVIAPIMVPENYVIIFFTFSGVMGILSPAYYRVFKGCDVEVIQQGVYETDSVKGGYDTDSDNTIDYED
eukprot:Clim_evm2s99 gene=Clim_evmTU2s99